MKKFVVKNEENGRYLAAINLSKDQIVTPLLWLNPSSKRIMEFEEEEAQAVIDFIRDVMDWELAEMLEAVPVEEGRHGPIR